MRSIEEISAYPGLMAIVIPYRNRVDHLDIFLNRFPEYANQKEPYLNYKIIVSEQPAGLPFIRGLTINIGAICAKTIGADNIFISDVDMIPITSNHTRVDKREARVRFPKSEGSCIVHTEDFFESGGYNNEYAGWGGEDDEFYMRLGLIGVRMTSIKNNSSLIYDSLKHPHQLVSDLYGRNKGILEYYMNISYEEKKNHIRTTGLNNIENYATNIRYRTSDKIIYIDYDIHDKIYSL